MNIIILHDSNSTASNQFVASQYNPSRHKLLIWYDDSYSVERQNYVIEGHPIPTLFPSVVELNTDIIVPMPITMSEAVTIIEYEMLPQIEKIRLTRNSLLVDSDWTQLSDSVLSDGQKTQWKIYRQQLRDYPENWLQDNTISFPVQPE